MKYVWICLFILCFSFFFFSRPRFLCVSISILALTLRDPTCLWPFMLGLKVCANTVWLQSLFPRVLLSVTLIYSKLGNVLTIFQFVCVCLYRGHYWRSNLVPHILTYTLGRYKHPSPSEWPKTPTPSFRNGALFLKIASCCLGTSSPLGTLRKLRYWPVLRKLVAAFAKLCVVWKQGLTEVLTGTVGEARTFLAIL